MQQLTPVVLGLIALVLACDTTISPAGLPAERPLSPEAESSSTLAGGTEQGTSTQSQLAPTATPSPIPMVKASLPETSAAREETGAGHPYILNEAPPLGAGVEIGKRYPHSLYAHCGVRDARFDGRTWMATPMYGGYNAPQGWTRDDFRGTMELVRDDQAVFTANSGRIIKFKPWPSEIEWGPCY